MGQTKTILGVPKKWALVILGFGLLLVAIFVFGSFWLETKIKNRIDNVEGLKYSTLEAGLFGGSLQIDSVRFEKIFNGKESSNFQCDKIKVDGIKWWQSWKNKSLLMGTVHLQGLHAALHTQTADSIAPERNWNLPVIRIDKFHLDGATINWSKNNEKFLEASDLSLQLADLNWQPTSSLKDSFFTHLQISSGPMSWYPPQDPYNYHLQQLSGKAAANTLNIQDFLIQPKFSKAAWGQQFAYKKSRMDVAIDEIEMGQLDFPSLYSGKSLDINTLTITNAKLMAFLDDSMKKCQNCYKPLFNEDLLKFDFPLFVEKTLVKNLDIFIEVLAEGATKAGEVSFEDTYATLYNITNKEKKIQAKPEATVEVVSQFMGKEKLEVAFAFALDDPEFGYQYEASMDRLDLKAINQMISFSSGALIETGVLSQLNFSVTGNNNLAKGSMKCGYENLKVLLVDKQNQDSKKILSKIVNAFAINKENKPESEDFRQGKMHFPRERNTGTFSQFWKTIQSGLESTLLKDFLLPKELK